jgi:flagellar basal-body rod protein FlgC
MSFAAIYDASSSAMRAQVMRLDTIASNMANANTSAESEETAFRALKPVFSTIYGATRENQSLSAQVQMLGVTVSDRTVEQRFEPNNPMANESGYVYYSNVNIMEEMADMISASRSYQTSVEVMNRAVSMQQSILRMGQ